MLGWTVKVQVGLGGMLGIKSVTSTIYIKHRKCLVACVGEYFYAGGAGKKTKES